MPLLAKWQLPEEGLVGIWEVTEPISYFDKILHLHPAESDEIAILSDRKKLEWVSSRHLLHILSGRHDRGLCYKDQYGKPHLADSDYEISMSHSGTMVSVIAGPKLVGVDIQIIVPKITRLMHKFVHPDEISARGNEPDIEELHRIWGAKECLYKAYGKRGLDFKKNMFIGPFVYVEDYWRSEAILEMNDYSQWHFDIFARTLSNYILVYAIFLD